jgi:hypothetical protein
MRSFFVGILLLIASSAAFAQANLSPKTLAADIDALSARVSKLEGNLAPADVAGLYVILSLEVETGALAPAVHHGTQVGALRLTDEGTSPINGSFVLTSTDTSSHLNLTFAKDINNSTVPGTLTANTTLTGATTMSSGAVNDTGQWSLSGKVLTLTLSGGQAFAFMIAGSRLFVNASNNGSDHTLIFLIRAD